MDKKSSLIFTSKSLNIFGGNIDYLEKLRDSLSTFIKGCPLPLYIDIEKEEDRAIFIRVSLGQKISYTFVPDETVSPVDQIDLIDNYFRGYYPSYIINLDSEIEIPLSPDEISNLIHRGVSPDEAISMKKMVMAKETGTIDKITLKKDQFRIHTEVGANSFYSHRVSTIPLSLFMKEIRSYRSGEDKDIHLFIHNNSKVIKISESISPRELYYKSEILYNSLSIQKSILNKTVIQLSENRFKLGRNIYNVNPEDIDMVVENFHPVVLENY